jgi:hypothetical protein
MSTIGLRYLDIGADGAHPTLSFECCLNEMPVLQLRERELRKRLRGILERAGWRTRMIAPRIALCIAQHDQTDIGNISVVIEDAVEDIAFRPLSPKDVERSLHITAQERIRWTKDGRLKTSGSGSFRKGQAITFKTYCVVAALKSAANPGAIARWRRPA